jgi:simple sugar transport system ATP-binding protein
MDEPTAAISVRQVKEVLDLIQRLKDSGHAVILVAHRMPDVFEVCDRVAVLRRGTRWPTSALPKPAPKK